MTIAKGLLFLNFGRQKENVNFVNYTCMIAGVPCIIRLWLQE